MKTNDVTRITAPACWLDKGHGRTAPLYIWTCTEWLNYRPLTQGGSYWIAVADAAARAVCHCAKLRS